MYWIVLIVALILATMFLVTAFAAIYGAPFVPTPTGAIHEALKLAEIGPEDVFVDIGAGDGRVAIAASAISARSIGYELSPFMFLVCLCNAWRKKSRAVFRLRDGFRADVSDATIVFMFLMPKTNTRALKRLSHTLRSGTKILTYSFPINGWEPELTVRSSELMDNRSGAFGTVRLYIVK